MIHLTGEVNFYLSVLCTFSPELSEMQEKTTLNVSYVTYFTSSLQSYEAGTRPHEFCRLLYLRTIGNVKVSSFSLLTFDLRDHLSIFVFRIDMLHLLHYKKGDLERTDLDLRKTLHKFYNTVFTYLINLHI